MQKVNRKIKLLKEILKKLDHYIYSGIQLRTVEALADLKKSQKIMLSSPSREKVVKEMTCMKNWKQLAKAEETFLRQNKVAKKM